MRRRPATLIAALAAAAVLVAGCGGGGSSPGVANVGTSTSTTSSGAAGPPSQAQLQQAERAATNFARCMRAHGVSLPNPTVAPRAFKGALNNQTPAFRSAFDGCGHLLPPGHPQNQPTPHSQAQTAALLAFAHCLRNHGFPGFPDPTSGGQVTHEMLARAGIDLHQPALVAAADGCTGVTHGVITRAVVAHFVAGH